MAGEGTVCLRRLDPVGVLQQRGIVLGSSSRGQEQLQRRCLLPDVREQLALAMHDVSLQHRDRFHSDQAMVRIEDHPVTIDRGPNIGLGDLNHAVRDDPEFSQWIRPIPLEWYGESKRAYTLVDQEALYGSLRFSRFYGRNAADTIAGPTDVANRGKITMLRNGIEVIGVSGDSNVTTRNYIRNGIDGLAVPGEGAGTFRTSGALVNPMIDKWP